MQQGAASASQDTDVLSEWRKRSWLGISWHLTWLNHAQTHTHSAEWRLLFTYIESFWCSAGLCFWGCKLSYTLWLSIIETRARNSATTQSMRGKQESGSQTDWDRERGNPVLNCQGGPSLRSVCVKLMLWSCLETSTNGVNSLQKWMTVSWTQVKV